MKEKRYFPWGGIRHLHGEGSLSTCRSQRWRQVRGLASEGGCLHGNRSRPVAALGGRPEEAGELMVWGTLEEAESRCPGWHPAQTARLLPLLPHCSGLSRPSRWGSQQGSVSQHGTGSAGVGQLPRLLLFCNTGAQNHEILSREAQRNPTM